jgi:hypothetical protein
MAKMYAAFHALLISNSPGAFRCQSYLIEERGIAKGVVRDSMLGVVPAHYDVNALFDDWLQELRTESEENETDGMSNVTEHLEAVEGVRDKLRSCLRALDGCLYFFYTDKDRRIVAIRFREPFSKDIRYFKPFAEAGLFGAELGNATLSDPPPPFDETTIIVEGEFNALQLQSLALRYAKATNRERFYVRCAAVGGVHNADFEALHALDRTPTICYDNDTSGAGFALVTNANKHFGTWSCTTPSPDSDLDSYIREFSGDVRMAWRTVTELIQRRKFHCRSRQSVAREIYETRQVRQPKDLRRDFEINAEVAAIVRTDLGERGRFYYDYSRCFYFDHMEKTLVEIDKDDNSFRDLLNSYGLNPTEKIHDYVLQDLWHHAREAGKENTVYEFAHYEPKHFTLYVQSNAGRAYKISPSAIDLVDNGTDGVLFLRSENRLAIDVGLPVLPENRSLLDEIIVAKVNFTDDGLTPGEQRLLLFLWLLAIFFEELLPTKPILCLVGEKGSGKSITLRKIGSLLFGDLFDVTPLSRKEDDFDAAASHSYLLCIDNADSPHPWLNDRLASFATGSKIKKRILYTTNQMVEIPVRCWLAITSRTPEFTRDDVADRLLILLVGRFHKFAAERDLLDEVAGHREDCWRELLGLLQEVTVALKETVHYHPSVNFRMADFATFAVKVAKSANLEPVVERLLHKLSKSQSTFALHDDPVFSAIYYWCCDAENERKELSAAELCAALSEVAEEEHIDFPFRGSPRALAQRLNHLWTDLEKYFVMRTRTLGGRRRYYSFALRDDADLPRGYD